MFLWAKLVLDSASDVDSMSELHYAITTMPQKLSELYDKIFDNLCQQQAGKQTDKIMRFLFWLTFAKRLLTLNEILQGVSITPETPVLHRWTMLDKSAIEKCKPLVEGPHDGSMALIHFTAQEYVSRFWLRTASIKCIHHPKKGHS